MGSLKCDICHDNFKYVHLLDTDPKQTYRRLATAIFDGKMSTTVIGFDQDRFTEGDGQFETDINKDFGDVRIPQLTFEI